ncbi:MAG: O-antigen ligase family protein [Pseudolabrys sp.]
MSLAIPRRFADGVLPFATSALLFLALVLGGGSLQGRWSDALIQLASLPLLALVFFNPQLMRMPRGPIVLACLLIALPMVQLIPLPPALWTALPGREGIAQGYNAAGVALPWLPISLAPIITWHSLLSLLPVIAVFLATLCLSGRQRRILVIVILAFAFLSVLLDMLQMMQGESSSLRFYATATADRAVGFFANSNHNAAFLYCAMPLAVAWGTGTRRRPFLAVLIVLLLGAIVVGLALAQSRTGLILGAVAGISCLVLFFRDGKRISRRRAFGAIAGGSVVVLLIAFQFGFVSISKRVQDGDLMADLRWPVASITIKAALANLPFGTGFGTFVPVYQTVEPRSLLSDRYVNRAHDDWLELLLEGGVLSAFGILIFLAWFCRLSLQAWRPTPKDSDALDAAIPRAGTVIVLLLMLHSIVDYPLRTTGLMALFAIGFALLIRPNRQREFAGIVESR